MSEIASERTVADRYVLLEVIGRGGSSTVYRARDRDLDRIVAVKVVPLVGPAEDDRRRRREAAMLPALQHAALVSVLDQHIDDCAVSVVMELMPDGSLRDRIRDRPLQPSDVAAVGEDIAAALQHIHDLGIVHRDVKPANILLRQEAGVRAKLTDFGIAKLLDSGTTTTGLIGTAYYLSPEQASGGEVGPASDIYSLGLTLLEALTGRAAFPGTVAESIGARLLRDPGIPSGLSNAWRSVLGSMTARDPRYRPTAEQVSLRLRSLVVSEPIADTAQITIPLMPLADGTWRGRARSARVQRRARTHRARLGLITAATALGLAAASTVVAAAPAFGPGAAEAAVIADPSPSPSAPVGRPSATVGDPRTASRSVTMSAPSRAAPSRAPVGAEAAVSVTREKVASPPVQRRAVGHGAVKAKGATSGKGKKKGQHGVHPGH